VRSRALKYQAVIILRWGLTLRNEDTTHVAKGSAYLIIQVLVSALISAVGFAFTARILTQVEMGVVVALTLTQGVALLISDMGFSSGLTKYISEYRGRDIDHTHIAFTGIFIKASVAMVITAFLAAMAPITSEWLLRDIQYTFAFQLFSIDILIACIVTTLNSLLLGMGRIRELALVNVVSGSARQASAVILLLYGYGLLGLVAGWIIGSLIHFGLSIFLVVGARSVQICSLKEVMQHLKILAKFSSPLFITNTVMFLYNWFDRALLLAFVPLSEVAVYNVAYSAFTVLYAVPTALKATLFPFYGEQYGRNKQENIVIGVRASTRYIALLYTPLALGLAATASPVITLFAGATYTGGDTILATLSFFGGISCLEAALGTLLLTFEMTPAVLLINCGSVGASLAMSSVLLPQFQTLGMAIVKGISLTITLVLSFVLLRKRLSIQFDIEAIRKSWIGSTIMFIVVGLLEKIYFRANLLPFYIFAGGGVYLLVLRILKAVNEKDLELIRSLVGARADTIVNVARKILT